jgi:hypothetical protein
MNCQSFMVKYKPNGEAIQSLHHTAYPQLFKRGSEEKCYLIHELQPLQASKAGSCIRTKQLPITQSPCYASLLKKEMCLSAVSRFFIA